MQYGLTSYPAARIIETGHCARISVRPAQRAIVAYAFKAPHTAG